jgi:CheY-like chemotaxis protein
MEKYKLFKNLNNSISIWKKDDDDYIKIFSNKSYSNIFNDKHEKLSDIVNKNIYLKILNNLNNNKKIKLYEYNNNIILYIHNLKDNTLLIESIKNDDIQSLYKSIFNEFQISYIIWKKDEDNILCSNVNKKFNGMFNINDNILNIKYDNILKKYNIPSTNRIKKFILNKNKNSIFKEQNILHNNELYNIYILNIKDEFYIEYINKIYNDEFKYNFLMDTSNKIRTPLNGIIGLIDVLTNTELNKEQKEYISLIRNCSINILNILNDVIDFFMIKLNKIIICENNFNLNRCVKNVIDIINIQYNKRKIDIELNIHNIGKIYYGDDSRIQQILINVIEYVIRIIKNNEKIKIYVNKLEDLNDDRQLIGVNIEYNDKKDNCKLNNINNIYNNILTNNNDNDILINDDNYENANNINNLSLYITHELVKLLNGKLNIKNENNKTTISMIFNLKYIHIINLLKNKNILLIDQNHNERIKLGSYLNKNKMNITLCSSSKEALNIYICNDTYYDIILIDSVKLDMDYIKFARNIKNNKTYKDTKLLLLINNEELIDNDDIYYGYIMKQKFNEQFLNILVTIFN